MLKTTALPLWDARTQGWVWSPAQPNPSATHTGTAFQNLGDVASGRWESPGSWFLAGRVSVELPGRVQFWAEGRSRPRGRLPSDAPSARCLSHRTCMHSFPFRMAANHQHSTTSRVLSCGFFPFFFFCLIKCRMLKLSVIQSCFLVPQTLLNFCVKIETNQSLNSDVNEACFCFSLWLPELCTPGTLKTGLSKRCCSTVSFSR